MKRILTASLLAALLIAPASIAGLSGANAAEEAQVNPNPRPTHTPPTPQPKPAPRPGPTDTGDPGPEIVPLQ